MENHNFVIFFVVEADFLSRGKTIRIFLLPLDKRRFIENTFHIELNSEDMTPRYGVPMSTLIPGEHFDSSVSENSIRKATINDETLEFIVKLKRLYLINHLSIKILDNEQMQYQINISLDGNVWEPIVNYFAYRCHGQQEIYFEAKPVKYVQFLSRKFHKSLLPIHSYESASSSKLSDKFESF